MFVVNEFRERERERVRKREREREREREKEERESGMYKNKAYLTIYQSEY